MPDIDYEYNGTVAKITISPVRTAVQLDHLLDVALGDTFPASDPVSELRVNSPAIDV